MGAEDAEQKFGVLTAAHGIGKNSDGTASALAPADVPKDVANLGKEVVPQGQNPFNVVENPAEESGLRMDVRPVEEGGFITEHRQIGDGASPMKEYAVPDMKGLHSHLDRFFGEQGGDSQ
jgi:hypothetical protein